MFEFNLKLLYIMIKVLVVLKLNTKIQVISLSSLSVNIKGMYNNSKILNFKYK